MSVPPTTDELEIASFLLLTISVAPSTVSIIDTHPVKTTTLFPEQGTERQG
jgi:hypothetical protein